jgi:hypothetical protein
MTTTSTKTLEIKVERTIPAPASEVFDAWLDPTIPGTPWHENDKLIVNPKETGFGIGSLWGHPPLWAVYGNKSTSSNPTSYIPHPDRRSHVV